METIVVVLNSSKMENPDLDIRYVLPDMLQKYTQNEICDNGYDYITNEELGIWLSAREFDSFIFQKNLAGLIKPAFFMSIFLFYFIVLYSIIFINVVYYIKEVFTMKVTTSKSKNSESFYIAKSFIDNKGKSTSVNVRKLGTLKELLAEHGPTRN
ncbi:hypothetical protein FMM75_07130, partial [Lachnospiraceae bacterium MD335]|nr:hypothetical protein [Lachnospiraceae bacterium MD335]